MKIKDLRNLLQEIREEALKRELKNTVVHFENEDSGISHSPVNTVSRLPDGYWVVGLSDVDRDDYDLDVIERKISKADEEAMVYYVKGFGRNRFCNISKDWKFDDDGRIIIQAYGDNGMGVNPMTVGQLNEILSQYDSRNIGMRVSDGKKLKDVKVDGYCFKSAELVLHANVYQMISICPPSTSHLIHELKFLDSDCNVCFMNCYKTPGLHDFYDITGYHLNDNGDLVLDVSMRKYTHLFSS